MSALDGAVGGREAPALSWLVVAALAAAAVVNAVQGALLWSGFAAVAVGVASVPAVVRRDARATVPPELLALTALPVFARSFGAGTQVATYVAVAALALTVVVEIAMFSETAMTRPFAVGFVVLTTMAVAGAWTVAQGLSDMFLGTTILRSIAATMWDLIVAILAGTGAGVLFELYFRRYDATAAVTWDGDTDAGDHVGAGEGRP